MIIWSSKRLRSGPVHLLAHYAFGAMPLWLSPDRSGPVGWVKFAHRGLQRPDRIHVNDRQRRYVFHKRFDFRVNTAFEEVIRACADPGRDGKTWITEELIVGYLQLHRMGFAHSFEAWENGSLVGGTFGVQLGSLMTLDSIFHRANHAGKAAYVRALLHLRDRGFDLIDVNANTQHNAQWGSEWVPQWEFERLTAPLLSRRVSILDGVPPPVLPWIVRARLPVMRAMAAIDRRIRRRRSQPEGPPAANAPAAVPPAAVPPAAVPPAVAVDEMGIEAA